MAPLALSSSSGVLPSGTLMSATIQRPLGAQRPLPSCPRARREGPCGGLRSSGALCTRQLPCSLRRRSGSLVVAAAGGSNGGGGGGSGSEAPKESQLKLQLQLLGTILVRYPALYGTVAVAAGYFLHIDPLGGLHWNSHDALLGLKCAVPILIMDAVLMLPDYSPGTTTKTIKLKVPRVVAEKMKQMEAAKAAKAAKEAKEAGTEAGASSAPDADADAADSSSSGSGAGAGLKQRSLSITSEGVSIKVIDLSEIAGSESSSSDSESDSSSSSSSSSSVASSAAEQPQAQQQAAGPSEATAPAAAAAGAAPPVAGVVAAEATAATAEGLQEKPDEDLVEIEKKIPVRGKQHPLLAALYRAQMEKAVDNVGRLLPYPFELVLVLTWHLAEEMLYRGIVLTWAAGWTIDRLYEAGADETVNLLGTQLATPQAGALFAAVGCATVSLALLVQRSLFPIQLIKKAEEELAATEEKDARQEERKQALEAAFGMPSQARKQKAADTLKERARMRKVLDKVKVGLVRQRAWSTAIEGTRDLSEWALYSTSYLLTGNLLAPYVTACTSDLLFSIYQRLKARKVEESMKRSLDSIRELTDTAAAVAAARKQALTPPAASSKSEGGSSAEGSESSGSSNGKAGSEEAEQQRQGGQQGQQEQQPDGSSEEPAAPVGARGSSSSKGEE